MSRPPICGPDVVVLGSMRKESKAPTCTCRRVGRESPDCPVEAHRRLAEAQLALFFMADPDAADR